MNRLLIASLLSGVLMMAWGFVFWALSPLPIDYFKPLPNQDAIVGALKEQLPASGVYIFPSVSPGHQGDPTKDPAFVSKHKAGPIGLVVFHREGDEPMAPMTYAKGMGHFILTSFLLGLLMLIGGVQRRSFLLRWLFVGFAGAVAGVMICLSQPIWFHYPWDSQLFYAAYFTSSSLIGGLALAILLRSPRATLASL